MKPTVWRHTGNERITGALAQSAKCATAPIRHLSQVKTLTTRACLKHSDFHKIDNRIEMCPTADHMKPFSMKGRIRLRDRQTHYQLLMRSESDKTIETCEINISQAKKYRTTFPAVS